MVTGYLSAELMKMGYRLVYHRSAKSTDSWYIHIQIGSPEQPKVICLRISDHDLPPKYSLDHFDVDICCSHLRNNAVTCIDFLFLFAVLFGKRIPSRVIDLLPGTEKHEAYISSLRSPYRARAGRH